MVKECLATASSNMSSSSLAAKVSGSPPGVDVPVSAGEAQRPFAGTSIRSRHAD